MTKALETIAKLNPMVNLHKAHIMQVTAILVGGESYCGELGDVLVLRIADWKVRQIGLPVER